MSDLPETLTIGKDGYHYLVVDGPVSKTKYIRADIVEDVLRFIPCHCHKEHGDNEACPALKIERLLGGKR